MGGRRGKIKSVKETGWEGSCGTSEARAESSWAQLMVVVEMGNRSAAHKSGMGSHACKPSTWETEAREHSIVQ